MQRVAPVGQPCASVLWGSPWPSNFNVSDKHLGEPLGAPGMSQGGHAAFRGAPGGGWAPLWLRFDFRRRPRRLSRREKATSDVQQKTTGRRQATCSKRQATSSTRQATSDKRESTGNTRQAASDERQAACDAQCVGNVARWRGWPKATGFTCSFFCFV